jgi:hypothetical protein
LTAPKEEHTTKTLQMVYYFPLCERNVASPHKRGIHMTHPLRIRVRCAGIIPLLLVLLAVGSGAMITGCAPLGQPVSKAPRTPTPLSTRDQIHHLALQATGRLLTSLQVVYSQAAETAGITGTLAGTVPRTPGQISTAHETVKVLCFEIQRALWTSSIHLRDVTVTILGPVLDDYYDRITSWYGTADLLAGNAAKLAWGKLSADAAWNLFGKTALRVDYASFQQWGAPTPSPTSGV